MAEESRDKALAQATSGAKEGPAWTFYKTREDWRKGEGPERDTRADKLARVHQLLLLRRVVRHLLLHLQLLLLLLVEV